MKRRWCLAGVIAACVACNDEPSAGGLMLMVVQDGSLDPDSLHLDFSPAGRSDAKPRVWSVPKEAQLPATLALNWTKDSSPETTLDASLWSGATLLDRRQFTITKIPTRYYAAIPLLFGARCARAPSDTPSTSCPSGQTCDPRDGSCVSQQVDASKLPEFEPGMEDTFTWDQPHHRARDGGTNEPVTSPSSEASGAGTPGSSAAAGTSAGESSAIDVTRSGSATGGDSSSQSRNETSSDSPNTDGPDVSHLSDAGSATWASSDPLETTAESSWGSTSREVEGGAPCEPGEYWAASYCAPWRTCSPGTYISIEGTATTDRVCETCPDAHFSSQTDALVCSPFTRCGFRDVLDEGSPTADVLCSSMDVVFQFGGEEADTASAMALDSRAAVYTVGSSRGALTQDASNLGGWDAFIHKRESTGAFSWSRQFGTSSYDRANGVTINDDGDITVTGYTEGALASGGGALADIFLRRYSSDGDVRWTSQYGTANLDMPYGVAETSEGNLVVTGRTYGSLSGLNAGESDFFVSQFDAHGAHDWSQQIGTSGDDWGLALTVDGLGDIIAVGHMTGGFGGTDVAMVKLTPSGVVSWQKSFGSNADDVATAVATDHEGNIYVSGYTYGRLGSQDPQGPDAWVSKRDPDGDMIWIHQFGTDGSDGAQSIAVHGTRVYVAGNWGSGDNFTDYDVFVRSYTLDGTDPQTRTLGTSEDEYALGMAVTDDRLFVCGDTYGPLGATNAGEYDAFVAQVVVP